MSASHQAFSTTHDLPESTMHSATEEQIRNWLVDRLSARLESSIDTPAMTIPFDRLGVDSMVAVEVAGELQAWLKVELEPTLLYDYVTIASLARHLAELTAPSSDLCN